MSDDKHNIQSIDPWCAMRNVLIGVGVVFLIATGGAIGFILRLEQPDRQVLGDSTVHPFWQNTVLLVNDVGTLFSWDRHNAPQPVPVLAGKRVQTSATTPDAMQLVVVTSENGTATFWLYEADRAAKPIAAVQGSVSKLLFSPSGKQLLFVQQREQALTPELDLLTLDSGTIRRIAENSSLGVWLADPAGIVSRTNEGNLWYHTFLADGSIDATEVPVTTASTIAALGQDRVLLAKSDGDVSLVRLSLSTQEQELIVPLPSVPTTARDLQLFVIPPGSDAILAGFSENGEPRTAIIRLESGDVRLVRMAVRHAVWLDGQTVLVESAHQQGTELGVLDRTSGRYQAIPETSTLHLLP